MINNREELEECLRMLQGNINRLCVSDDLDELSKMKEFAIKRINEIYIYNIYQS